MNQNKLTLFGFLQALGLVAYCTMVACLIWKLGRLVDNPPGFSGIVFWLFLLALSVAVCGLLIFGYPTYLVVTQKRVREALYLLLYTLLSCIGIIAVLMVIIFYIN